MVTPKSSILIGFSIINHPFWGTPIFGNTLIYTFMRLFGFAMCLHEYLKQNTDSKLFSALDDMHRISMQWNVEQRPRLNWTNIMLTMKEASNANDREDIAGMGCLGTKGDTQHHEGVCWILLICFISTPGWLRFRSDFGMIQPLEFVCETCAPSDCYLATRLHFDFFVNFTGCFSMRRQSDSSKNLIISGQSY